MTGFAQLEALLERPGAVDQRPNLYDGFTHRSAPDDIASDWSWPSFGAGLIVGAMIGVALLAGGAILLAMRVLS